VLVYPGAFVVDRTATDAAGLARDERRALAGESWQQGQVILSWDDVLAGAADPDDGRNVVIHEFAHQLDQESGRATGPLPGPARALHALGRRAGAEFEALRQRLARDEPGLIEPYAATDPAKFFAVVSELFFEQPAALAAQHPALYGELARYYRATRWAGEPSLSRHSSSINRHAGGRTPRGFVLRFQLGYALAMQGCVLPIIRNVPAGELFTQK